MKPHQIEAGRSYRNGNEIRTVLMKGTEITITAEGISRPYESVIYHTEIGKGNTTTGLFAKWAKGEVIPNEQGQSNRTT